MLQGCRCCIERSQVLCLKDTGVTMGKDFAVKHQQLVAFSASAIDNKMYTEITKNRIAEETCGKDFPNKRR